MWGFTRRHSKYTIPIKKIEKIAIEWSVFWWFLVISELGSWIYIVMAKNFQICFYPTFFFSINSTYMKRILHSENVTPKSSYNWLKIRGFFQSGEGTWLEFLWGGGTKLELGYWVKIVIINQIPPGGGTANLKSRNLSRKKVSCTTILQSTGRGHSTGITIPKTSGQRSLRTTGRGHWDGIHGAGALNWNFNP